MDVGRLNRFIAITSCSCVGVVGATLGAGVGRFQGIHGLIIDALLSVRLVTAKGRIITASATEYSDLFWGLRGAGANFGIILSATYKITDHSNGGNVMSADLIFPASANVSYFNTLKNFQDKLPAELALFTTIFYDASAQEVMISLDEEKSLQYVFGLILQSRMSFRSTPSM